MTVSLYDLSVGSFLQTVSGVRKVLQMGATYASENDIDVNTYVKLRVHDDMLPMLFQIACMPMHSTESIKGIESGVFTPSSELKKLDYAGMQAMVEDTYQALTDLSEDHVNSLSGKPVLFKMGDLEMPFTAETFVMSFSLPNLNFHATTAYDLLRAEGVPLTKAHYLGRMRMAT